ncbi:hypothetical protein Fot_55295 [Forsythia ovata]|uniref:Pentapeptide repeat-containing protein n=1 Tax=Forsythia ovata TaxID=205694 RepID=A0ABD1P7B1_9LAMI
MRDFLIENSCPNNNLKNTPWPESQHATKSTKNGVVRAGDPCAASDLCEQIRRAQISARRSGARAGSVRDWSSGASPTSANLSAHDWSSGASLTGANLRVRDWSSGASPAGTTDHHLSRISGGRD